MLLSLRLQIIVLPEIYYSKLVPLLIRLTSIEIPRYLIIVSYKIAQFTIYIVINCFLSLSLIFFFFQYFWLLYKVEFHWDRAIGVTTPYSRIIISYNKPRFTILYLYSTILAFLYSSIILFIINIDYGFYQLFKIINSYFYSQKFILNIVFQSPLIYYYQYSISLTS